MKKRIFRALMMMCLVGTSSAQAVTTLYTSEAAYLATVGATTTYIDFAGSPAVAVGGGTFSSAVTFGTCDGGLATCSTSVFHNSNAITDMGGVVAPNNVAALGATFTNPVYAFGFNYISGGMGSIELNGTTLVPVDTASSGFVGIVSSDAITGFVGLNYIFPGTTNRDRYFIDDFFISAVPEPNAWALMIIGLTLLGFRAIQIRR